MITETTPEQWREIQNKVNALADTLLFGDLLMVAGRTSDALG
jgi:hypothetical protein